MLITRSFEWDAAHRITRHESRCRFPHGHRYRAEVTVFAPDLDLDPAGRVVDFGVVKEKVGSWIDTNWDHNTLVSPGDTGLIELVRSYGANPYLFDPEPTAECIVMELMRVATELLAPLKVLRVRVWETPNCWAEAS